MLRSTRDIALLLVLAIGIGFLMGRIAPTRAAAPTPTPTPSPTPTPLPTPITDDPRVWSQPLVAGCRDGDDAYVVSAGGGIARFDSRTQTWYLVDDTLRSMRAVVCFPGLIVAVGDGSRLIRIDPSSQTVAPELPLGPEDIYAVDAIDPATIVVAGSELMIRLFTAGKWEQIGGGVEDRAWRATLYRSSREIWFAGDNGLLFMFDGKDFVDRSIANGPQLTALSWLGSDVLVGAADGTLYSASAKSDPRAVGHVKGPVRALLSFGSGAYVLSDQLTTFGTTTPATLSAETLGANGLSCTVTAMFTNASGELWLIGQQGSRAGVARYDGVWTKWGRC